MNTVCNTLFAPVMGKAIDLGGARLLFLNARYHPVLKDIDPAAITMQQYFKPTADTLALNGFVSIVNVAHDEVFDIVFLLFPKNITEGLFHISLALKHLCNNGILVCAADNNAGGARLEKIFKKFNIADIQSISKNKCRVVWGWAKEIHQHEVEASYSAGLPQPVLQNRFISQAGIFGWDKIDRGSEILLAHLPQDLKGVGADFGCGYGYLSHDALAQNSGITSMDCIDADYRALDVCRKNLTSYNNKIRTIWRDLGQENTHEKATYDFILMNPPFHEGKKVDTAIGRAFIQNAAHSLKKDGVLYIVANTHLPYEEILRATFNSTILLCEKGGFKVYKAL